MNRRGLLKGLAAVPVSAVLSRAIPADMGHSARATQKKLQIVLDGPFAIVRRQNDPAHVSAFVAIEPSDLHVLAVNEESEENTQKTHVFQFVADPGALKPNTTPTLDPCLQPPFSFTSKETEHRDLVKVSFPIPDRIFCDESKGKVTLVNQHQFDIPQGYILEYTVLDASKLVKVTDTFTQKDFKPVSSGNNLTITFEVGLYIFGGSHRDRLGIHAVEFHNNQLLSYFPDIDKSQFAFDHVDFNDAAVRKLQFKKSQPVIDATVVECQAGGILVNVTNG